MSHHANKNEPDMEGHQRSEKQMRVHSPSGMPEHSPEDRLKVNKPGGDCAESAQPTTIGQRRVLPLVPPFLGSKNRQADGQRKKRLSSGRMNNRQCLFKQHDAKPAEYA